MANPREDDAIKKTHVTVVNNVVQQIKYFIFIYIIIFLSFPPKTLDDNVSPLYNSLSFV